MDGRTRWICAVLCEGEARVSPDAGGAADEDGGEALGEGFVVGEDRGEGDHCSAGGVVEGVGGCVVPGLGVGFARRSRVVNISSRAGSMVL